MLQTKAISAIKFLLQFLLLLVSLLLIAEGLWGSQFAPKNLTTLFVWVHYRGFLVFALLLWGNLFCMSCPFIFVRNILRIIIKPKFLWPKKWQNKWVAFFCFCAVLFFYEYLSLWSSPKKTAVLIVLFFLGALFIDLLFKKAAFCKYVCPVGQFNFLSSTLSPNIVRAKSLSTCKSCTTIDCLQACETNLFIPKKQSNLDCSFCMDCANACPHNNVEVASIVPTTELWNGSLRFGIGKLSERLDIVALVIAFLFLGLMNAFLMTGPSFIIKDLLKNSFGIQSEFFLLLVPFLFFLLVLPATFFGIPEGLSRKITGRKFYLIPALLPLGFGIWVAHYSFHFLTGALTFIPLVSKIVIPPKYMGLSTSIVFPIEAGFLALGLLGSILVCLKLEENKKIRAFWISSLVALALVAFWIFSLPMEMRGTFVGIPA